MSLHNNTVPQVLYNTPDPHSQPAELYKIDGTVLATATDPLKCWVIREEHGVWNEATKTFENRATTLLPNEPRHCLSLDDLYDEIKKQVMLRVGGGFKYQMEWYPYAPPFFRKYEIASDGTRKQYA